MPVEVELKFSADGQAPLRVLSSTGRLGAATLGAPRTFDEIDRYLDTADGRLAAERWACRLRSREGWTRVSLKGPPEPGTGGEMHRRPEIEAPATDSLDPAAWPPSRARSFLDGLRGSAPLVERLRLVQRRTERGVGLGGEELGTLTLDVVGVEAGDRSVGRFHVVELELRMNGTADDEARLFGLGAALRAVDGLRPEPRTKLEHALGLLESP
jgi:inorganic triphosphatase YgiF